MSGPHTDAALRAWQRAGGDLRLTIRGWSMAPLLQPGDLITVRPCLLGQVRVGTVLVVQSAAGLLAHRLVRVEAGALILWGDAAPTPDPPAPGAALVGQVVARVRGARAVHLEGQTWRRIGERLAQQLPRPLARPALVLALALIEGVR